MCCSGELFRTNVAVVELPRLTYVWSWPKMFQLSSLVMPQTRALLAAITASAMLWRYSHVSSTLFARLYPAFLFWLLYPTSPHAHAPISRWHLVSVFRHLLARLVKCAVNHLCTNLRGTLSRHQPSFLFFRSFPTRTRSSLEQTRADRKLEYRTPLGKSTIGKFTRKRALTSSCISDERRLLGDL
jgi:hypothetical protein